MPNLSAVDTLVLTSYLVGTVVLGVWLGRGSQDAKTYLLGGRNAEWWQVLGSIVATETSTVTFLSVPGLAFAADGDLRFLQLSLGYIVGRSLVVVWLLPGYFRGELFTAYQVLFERFGGSTQRLGSLVFLVTRNLGDGLRLYLTAVVLKETLQWPIHDCIVVIGILTILFTVAGGMKSVIWLDCIQLCVYVLGGAIAYVLIAQRLPEGMGGIVDFAKASGRWQLLDFGFRWDDPFTFWAGLFGGAFLTLGTHGTDQMMVQRALAAKSQRAAGIALLASGFVVAAQFALFLMVGLALANFYQVYPERESFVSGDHVFASYIVHEMPVGIGLIGLLLAAVFSAAISTLSSSLNSSATAVVNDFGAAIRPDLTEQESVRWSRLFTVLFGCAQIGVGMAAVGATESVISEALAIAGFAAGLLLGLFALGSFAPQAVASSAFLGFAAGAGTLLLIRFVLPGIDWGGEFTFPTVAWPWYPVIGSVTTFSVGWLHGSIRERWKKNA